jgi:tRNA-Thr(GGU) m(6)t(6)A37 methyltransferase TsaA
MRRKSFSLDHHPFVQYVFLSYLAGELMKEIRYTPIGVIHSPFKDVKGMPIQTAAAKGIEGTVEVRPEYEEGLKDLEGFSHIILLYHFHRCQGYTLNVQPFMDDNMRGVFATRAPRRPNAIGVSVVKLVQVQGCTISIEDIDIADGTPLLDIKPYVPEFDVRAAKRTGWLHNKANKVHEVSADERFRREDEDH